MAGVVIYKVKDFLKNEKGQSVVELALILPVLIFLLLAIMEGGRIFAGYLELQHAARDGARYAAIHSADDETIFQSETLSRIKSRVSLLDPAKFSEAGNFALTRAGSDEIEVAVKLKYPMQIVTPVISTITGNTVTLETYMVMRGEGGSK